MRVYIAGPYTHGDIEANVNAALQTASILFDAGCFPYVPHLSHYWHIKHPRPYEDWMNLDKEWLLVCDAVLRIPGYSPGADLECLWAGLANIPIFTDYHKLVAQLCQVEPKKEA